MKFTSLLLLLVVLASCGVESTQVEEKPTINTEIIEETTSQIDAELENLNQEPEETTAETSEEGIVATNTEETAVTEDTQVVADGPKVVKVQAVYNNPKQEVYIDMEYILDNEGKIVSISMLDTNYDQEDLDRNLQVLIGKSVDEIDDTYISGGSLTIPAVKEALSQG